MHTTLTYNQTMIPEVAALLKQQMGTCSVFTFSGPLGTGKTTLLQTLFKLCGVQGYVTSPTFTYVNVYRNGAGQQFYHFDLYRIASLDAFINAGFNEYLYQPNSWCFIEWPDVVLPLLTHDLCKVLIDYQDHDKRTISITTVK